MKNFTSRLTLSGLLPALLLLLGFNAAAQVYTHDFGNTAITSYPYTVAPTTADPSISNSSWTNNVGIWVSFTGASGQALGHPGVTNGATLTLNFDVAPGKVLNVTSFSFWRQRTPTAAQNWTMTINGITVGNGSIPSTGTSTGTLPVTNPVTGLTGTVTVQLTLSNALGTGSFSLDDFTLNGSVADSCTPPVITSIMPANGPAETVVSIFGSGFQSGSGTTAISFNGTPAAGFTVIDDNEIKAVVPATGTTGPITVTTNSCESDTGTFTFISSTCPDLGNASEVFISELYDHVPGSYGMIELYNPTPNTITFGGQYVLERYGTIGDGAPTATLILPNSIGPNQTYLVISNIGDTPGCAQVPDASINTGINASDEFKLKKNGVIIDVAQAPASTGYTVIRKPNAPAPMATYNASNWTFSGNACTNLGIHNIQQTIQVSEQPESQSVCEGGTITFEVAINNPTGFTYQWKTVNDAGNWVNVTDDANFSGSQTATLTIVDVPLDINTDQYYCEMVSSGCTLISNAAQITVSPLPVAIVVVTPPTCTEGSGILTLTPAIGDDLEYSLDGITYSDNTIITGISSGDHTLYIQSSAGCVATMNIIVPNSPLAPAVAGTTVMQPDCSSVTGSIEITSPIDFDLEYSINGTDFQTDTMFDNIAPGSYTLTVQNSLGCTSDTTIVIEDAPIIPDVADFTVTQPTCTEGGMIVINTPLGADFTYSVNGIDFQAGTTFTDLAEGTYNIIVNHVDGCASVTSDIVIDPMPLAPAVATTTVTQATCTTGGVIEVTSPIGAGFTYSVNGTDFQTETDFTSLAAGTYNVTVMNADGCTSLSADIVVDPAPNTPAIATTTVTQPDCATATGTIEVTAPLGMDYSINGTDFQAGTTFTGLTPGSYTVTVMNSDGCMSQTASIAIDDVTPPAVATTTVTQPTCTQGGIIEVTAPAGMQYSVNGTDFQTDMTFTGLTEGTYNVTVMNADGCTSVTANITIDAAPAGPAVATTIVTQPTCTEGGMIEVTAPLGMQYSINGTDFQAGTTFTGLTEGNYTITVMNTDGCTTATATAVVIDPVPAGPAVATTTVTQPTCTEGGMIEVTAPLGMQYSINGTDFQPGTTFAGLTEGTYTVTVMNNDGCTSVTPATITIDPVPAAPAVATTTVTQPDCNDAGGTIEVTAPLGMQYSIDGTNFQGGTTFTDLAEGTYTVTVMGANGCSSVTSNITINAVPAAPDVATTTVTQPTCSDGGIIEVTAPLGMEYSIDGTNFQTATTFTGLTEGTYTVTVMNGGCTSETAAITINAAPAGPAVAATTVTQPTCAVTTGTIEVTSPLGTEYMYSIDGTNFQAGTTFSGVTANGTYSITVMTADGCTSTATGIVVNPIPAGPAVATTTVTQPTCTAPTGSIEVTAPVGAGLSYSTDGTTFQSSPVLTGLTPGQSYTVTVVNADMCTSQTATIMINALPAGPAVASVTVDQPDCSSGTGTIEVTGPFDPAYTYSIDGTTFQSGTIFSNVAPGTYTVTVQNADGCTSESASILVDEPVGAEVAQFIETQPTCAMTAGTIEVLSPVGAGYTYSIDGVNFQPTRFFMNLAPGTYTITVTNPSGCTSETEQILIEDIPVAPVVTGVEGCTPTTFGSSYVLEIMAENNSFDINSADIEWTVNGSVVASNTATFDAGQFARDNNIRPEDYPITVTVMVTTSTDCMVEYSYNLISTFCDIPRGISPNTDNKNDNFDLTGMNVKKLSIFNRYGKEVYTKSEYNNEWIGQADNGDELPTGTYFYVVELEGDSKTGWVYINREQ